MPAGLAGGSSAGAPMVPPAGGGLTGTGVVAGFESAGFATAGSGAAG
jgi:hypothetical protein